MIKSKDTKTKNIFKIINNQEDFFIKFNYFVV
jgi:hypothetical protein